MKTGGTENKIKNKKPVIYRYIGGGFIPGIPPRDITQEEATRLNIIKTLETSKLWVKEGE